MKKTIMAAMAAIALALTGCGAFEEGTISAYDYSTPAYGYYGPYYNSPYYNGPYYSWNTPPYYNPNPPVIVVPGGQPQRPAPSRPSSPITPPVNGQRPGANTTSVVPSQGNPFADQTQNWTTAPSTLPQNPMQGAMGGRRPGAR